MHVESEGGYAMENNKTGEGNIISFRLQPKKDPLKVGFVSTTMLLFISLKATSTLLMRNQIQ